MQSEKKSVITVSIEVNIPVEKVWNYWTGPEHVVNWNNASEDWHSPHAENDLYVGGKFNYVLAVKDGSFNFEFRGVYDEIVNHKTIKYTLGDSRKVEINFTEHSNKTIVTESFEAEDENTIELQQTGWQAILNNFKKYTESK
jgi:uncharacterized protein YndB with AHSA1/START domain